MVQYFPGVGKSLFAVMSAKPADEISRVRPIIDHLKPIVTPSIRQIGAMIMGKVLVILVAPVRVWSNKSANDAECQKNTTAHAIIMMRDIIVTVFFELEYSIFSTMPGNCWIWCWKNFLIIFAINSNKIIFWRLCWLGTEANDFLRSVASATSREGQGRNKIELFLDQPTSALNSYFNFAFY